MSAINPAQAWLRALPLLLAASGCSLFYDLNATQCHVTKDCVALGSAFADTSCVNQVCVASSTAGLGGSSDGGASGLGGKGSAGAVSGGSGGGAAADAGAAGDAGAGQAECTSNADCIEAHVQQPYLCQAGSCVALISDDCPVLVPSQGTLGLLETPAPIVIGGYANMGNPGDFHDSLAVINWDLAFSEFNENALGGGLPSKTGPARPVLALVCQSGAADISPSLTHLTSELHVPSILTTLSTDKLFSAFNFTQTSAYANAGGQPVLFLSTGSADLRLANLPDDGLVWHMLGDPRVLAATTVGLLKRIIPTVNAARLAAGDDPSTTPLRVTLVYSDDSAMTDLSNVLTTPDAAHPETLLTFNGKSAVSQLSGVGSGDFREVKIQSAKNYATPDVSAATTDLQEHPPHIVIAMATSEFPKTVIPALENSWGKSSSPNSVGLARPFYLASHLIYNTAELQAVAPQFSGTSPPLNERLVGVNYAEAQDAHSKQLYDSYEGRLQTSYQGALPLPGTENYYDGAYSMLYSLAAAYAARANPTGDDVRDGLQDRVFSTASSAVSVAIGPAAVGGAVSSMSGLAYKMSLWGTMGPPDFDRTSGTRLTPSSAWCIQQVSSVWAYQADGLIYNMADQTFSAPTSGVPPCLQQY